MQSVWRTEPISFMPTYTQCTELGLAQTLFNYHTLSTNLPQSDIKSNDTRRCCAVHQLRIIIDGNMSTTDQRSITYKNAAQHLKIAHCWRPRVGVARLQHEKSLSDKYRPLNARLPDLQRPKRILTFLHSLLIILMQLSMVYTRLWIKLAVS